MNGCSGNDYYPFGMMMPGRKYSATGSYRYGFNGKENDNELKGEGNTIAFENRIYDPRLGKWFSVDPLQKKYAGFSPYNFVENNPVVYIDKDGRDKWLNILITDERTGKTTQLSILLSHDIKAKESRVYTHSGYEDSYDWHDINLNYNITIDKDGKVNTTFKEEEGKYQTNTMFKWRWKAKANIWYNNLSRKEGDIGQGYLLTGKSGGLGDPLGPGAKKVDIIEDADAFLSMVGGMYGGEKGLIKTIAEGNGATKLTAFFEALSQAIQAGGKVGDAVNLALENLTGAEGRETPNAKPYLYFEPPTSTDNGPALNPDGKTTYYPNGSYSYPWGKDSIRNDKNIPSREPDKPDTVRSTVYPVKKKSTN